MVFTNTYENNLWGGAPGEYCSGLGSEDRYADAYGQMVREFILARQVHTVVALGCGDFNVGHKLLVPNVNYIGIDIVDGLIARNQQLFSKPNVLFKCLDIAEDELPQGDLCLIRQVLQHCSNQEIQIILNKLQRYKYVIVTEHYPPDNNQITQNKDKPHGSDTRVVDNSAVYLDAPPFNIKIDQLLLEMDAEGASEDAGEKIRTFLIVNPVFPNQA